MELFIQSLGIIVSTGGFFVVFILLAGLLAGAVRALTQIDEPALNLFAKGLVLLAIVYVLGGDSLSEVLGFSRTIWTESRFYF